MATDVLLMPLAFNPIGEGGPSKKKREIHGADQL